MPTELHSERQTQSQTELQVAEDAARLLRYGLSPKLRPGASPDYRELLRRYQHDAALRAHAEAIGTGLGLLVLGATEHGLTLGAEDSGPFAMRLGDYRRGVSSVADRLCHGLIQLAVAAWCFPTAQQLDERDSVAGVRVSVNRLVDYLVDLCNRFKQDSQDSDPEDKSPELCEAWRTILVRAQTRSSRDGRRSPSTLAGMVAHALEVLEEGGLLRRIGDEDGGTWQALGSYRIQVRELAAHDTFVWVRDTASKISRSHFAEET